MGHPGISADQILVFLVDDHQMWRQLLRLQLDLEPDLHVVGEAATGSEAVEAVAELAPDLVLLDLDLGGRSGLSYVGQLHEAAPSARILVLSGTDKVEDMVEAFRAGAIGFLSKQHPVEEFPSALRAVNAGQSLLPPEAASAVLSAFREDAKPIAQAQIATAGLSARELEVLNLLARSMSNREIASELFISENTVKNHVSNVLSKLEARTRVEAVTSALSSGLIDLPTDSSEI
jgi:two-component system NarL family response regulator